MVPRSLARQLEGTFSSSCVLLQTSIGNRNSWHNRQNSPSVSIAEFSSHRSDARQTRSPLQVANEVIVAPCCNSRQFSTGDALSVMDSTPLRLMSLGGSITYGVGSSDGNGYRNSLRQILVANDYKLDMVGSRKAGAMEDNANEGWRGFRIDEILNKARKSVPVHMPNIFTINAGTNDCIQNFELDHAGKRMSDMLEYLWTVSPHSTIILSTLLMSANDTIELRILHMNKQLRELEERMSAEQRKLVVVDMQGSEGPRHYDLVDGIHPNDIGYNKMAKIWYKGIQKAILKRFL